MPRISTRRVGGFRLPLETRKVGGIRFVWIGRLVFSYCLRRKQVRYG